MKDCTRTFFDFLVDELKTPVDEVDSLGRSPFTLNAIFNPNKTELTPSVQRLFDMDDVKIDHPDKEGRTPFLIYYEHGNLALARMLLDKKDKKANIDQMDSKGLFALKYALIRRNKAEIELLIAKDADINRIDTKGRNLLHHAIIMSSATEYATFEIEQLLIDKGININLRDSK